MRSGIYGGTFDPPHSGHLIVAEHVADLLKLDRVFFIPSYQSPHKTPGGSSAPEHRLAMTRLAIAGNPLFECLDIEVLKPEVSFTVSTLEQLTRSYPDDAFMLMIGMDNYQTFHRWKDPHRILELATLAVMNRPGFPQQVNELIGSVHTEFVPVPDIDISSSDIRSRVRSSRSIRYIVPDAVADYVHTHHLFR
jgi:nicotinate-nucleotide adenylyltransferase